MTTYLGWLTVHVFHKRFSVCVRVFPFPFDFETGMWDLIVFVPDLCLAFCFSYSLKY